MIESCSVGAMLGIAHGRLPRILFGMHPTGLRYGKVRARGSQGVLSTLSKGHRSSAKHRYLPVETAIARERLACHAQGP
jgi:hypothetical protein